MTMTARILFAAMLPALLAPPAAAQDNPILARMASLAEAYNVGDAGAIAEFYTEDGALDEAMSVADGDVVLVPKGHHPCGSPYGYSMYYLNVMAGPLRKWRFKNDPAHDWIAQRDAG